MATWIEHIAWNNVFNRLWPATKVNVQVEQLREKKKKYYGLMDWKIAEGGMEHNHKRDLLNWHAVSAVISA